MPIKSKCCDSPITAKCMKCKQMCEAVENSHLKTKICFNSFGKCGYVEFDGFKIYSCDCTCTIKP